MRLRICIQRNNLPDVNTLWPIQKRHYKGTVAQLLEEVNKTFPLESDSWGLENYMVTIGAYECIHYHQIEAVFKDEDEVTIRPLQYAEVRARTLLGRDQITPDGRHLLDGIPFGRPQLKGVERRDLNIPPLKQLEYHDTERRDEQEREEQAKEDEPQDSLERLLLDAMSLQWVANQQQKANAREERESGHRSKRVKFSGQRDLHDESHSAKASPGWTRKHIENIVERAINEPDDSEDDESDDDFVPGNKDTSVDSDIDSSDASSESTNQEMNNKARDSSDSDTSSDSDSDSDSESSTSSSDSSGELASLPSPRAHTLNTPNDRSEQTKTLRTRRVAGISSPPNKEKCVAGEFVGVPRQGLTRTKLRNIRRRDSKKLKILKADGLLPHNATLADLPGKQTEETATKTTNVQNELNSLEQLLPDNVATPSHAISFLEQKRQDLINSILSGGIDVTDNTNGINDDRMDEEPEVQSSKAPNHSANTAKDNLVSSSDVANKAIDFVPASVSRRSKLDVAGATRMLFGALGSRVPKNQQDKTVIQNKLAGRNGRSDLNGKGVERSVRQPKGQLNSTIVTGPEDDATDPDAWRERIDLQAVECCEEGVQLSEPPFPFYQRWDPQQRLKKKRKLVYTETAYEDGDSELVEIYDKYNQDGTGDALNYDDEVEDDEYWEEGALLEDDGDEQDGGQYDPFPPLPDDISTLPLVDESSAKVGSYIIYRELACSAATKWQPTEVTRTARLDTKDDATGEWTILLAARDMPPREYDDDGNRIYTKFEMQGADDDEDEGEDENGRRRVIKWHDLQDPRLLAEKPVEV